MDTTNRTTTRRTKAQIAADRDALVALLRTGDHYQLTAPEAAELTGNPHAAADLAALAKAERIDRTIEVRWDTQRGENQRGLFGGAGVCKRNVATYRLPAAEWAAIRDGQGDGVMATPRICHDCLERTAKPFIIRAPHQDGDPDTYGWSDDRLIRDGAEVLCLPCLNAREAA